MNGSQIIYDAVSVVVLIYCWIIWMITLWWKWNTGNRAVVVCFKALHQHLLRSNRRAL